MRILCCLVLLAALLLPSTAAGEEAKPYGMDTSAPTGARFDIIVREWKTMPKKLDYDSMLVDLCRHEPYMCTNAAAEAVTLIDRAQGLKEFARLHFVENEINTRLTYVTDLEQWKRTEPLKKGEQEKSEVWSSPLEILRSGQGDCEDFANLKLFILWKSGKPLKEMELALVEYAFADSESQELHTFLTAKLKDWVVLDVPLRHARDSAVLMMFPPYEIPAPSVVADAKPAK